MQILADVDQEAADISETYDGAGRNLLMSSRHVWDEHLQRRAHACITTLATLHDNLSARTRSSAVSSTAQPRTNQTTANQSNATSNTVKKNRAVTVSTAESEAAKAGGQAQSQPGIQSRTYEDLKVEEWMRESRLQWETAILNEASQLDEEIAQVKYKRQCIEQDLANHKVLQYNRSCYILHSFTLSLLECVGKQRLHVLTCVCAELYMRAGSTRGKSQGATTSSTKTLCAAPHYKPGSKHVAQSCSTTPAASHARTSTAYAACSSSSSTTTAHSPPRPCATLARASRASATCTCNSLWRCARRGCTATAAELEYGGVYTCITRLCSACVYTHTPGSCCAAWGNTWGCWGAWSCPVTVGGCSIRKLAGCSLRIADHVCSNNRGAHCRCHSSSSTCVRCSSLPGRSHRSACCIQYGVR